MSNFKKGAKVKFTFNGKGGRGTVQKVYDTKTGQRLKVYDEANERIVSPRPSECKPA
jgi:hypothetical protein